MTRSDCPSSPRTTRSAWPKVAAGSLVVLLGISGSAATALAADTTTTAPGPATTAPGAPTAGTAGLAAAKARAEQRIERRLDALDRLGGRITADAALSPTVRAALGSAVQSDRQALTALGTQISADTSRAAIRTDVQAAKDAAAGSVGPKDLRAALGAGRLETRLDKLTEGVPRLQTRIQAAQAAGKDVSGAQAALTDLQAKAADATHQIDVAVTAATSGNAAGAAAARTAVTADLKAIRSDLGTIRKALGTPKSGAAPTTAAPTTGG